MSQKKILVLLGHPDKDSLCCELADSYAFGAQSVVHQVKRVNIGDLNFDPILHHGYKVIQELEPDLKQLQEDIKWCDHLVIVYPSWWSTMPALLKGLFDRMWLPGFAYSFNKNGWGWKKLLKGRTATVFVTSDSRPILARLLFGDNTNEIQDGILWFAGFHVRMKKCGPMKKISEQVKENWRQKFVKWGKMTY